ncbi:hypothetical protein NLI96_g664 [Meripilus lineatus]|uniref:Uncharacterized protein n=1 Tax=Meripilus lineatus TaxID=2056292 RepID=A0AAD5VBY2_9APHY|nr:hypothetical protein NLI96_g664 [Physisporinus lineatus]
MSATMSLPNLEILCVRGVFTSPFVTYASLPRMHTLQVVQICKWLQGIRGAIPPLSAFPALRTIEFFQNTYSGVELTQDLMQFLPQISRIHLIGANFELSLFRLWALSNRLDSVKYLVVGVMTSTPRFISTWRFPKRLEVLTFIVQLDPFYLSMKDEMDVVLENLYRCLEYNGDCIKEGSLRKLIIMTRTRSLGSVPQAEHASMLIDLIRDFCRTRGLEFVFDQTGEYITFHSPFPDSLAPIILQRAGIFH